MEQSLRSTKGTTCWSSLLVKVSAGPDLLLHQLTVLQLCQSSAEVGISGIVVSFDAAAKLSLFCGTSRHTANVPGQY